jgi:hypothetical protein
MPYKVAPAYPALVFALLCEVGFAWKVAFFDLVEQKIVDINKTFTGYVRSMYSTLTESVQH